MLRARMLGLTDAILRISEDLDVDVVLQEVVDTARALTGARYGAIVTLDDAGELQDLLLSGMPRTAAGIDGLPPGLGFVRIPQLTFASRCGPRTSRLIWSLRAFRGSGPSGRSC